MLGLNAKKVCLYPAQVVGRGNETQLHVAEKNEIFKLAIKGFTYEKVHFSATGKNSYLLRVIAYL